MVIFRLIYQFHEMIVHCLATTVQSDVIFNNWSNWWDGEQNWRFGEVYSGFDAAGTNKLGRLAMMWLAFTFIQAGIDGKAAIELEKDGK